MKRIWSLTEEGKQLWSSPPKNLNNASSDDVVLSNWLRVDFGVGGPLSIRALCWNLPVMKAANWSWDERGWFDFFHSKGMWSKMFSSYTGLLMFQPRCFISICILTNTLNCQISTLPPWRTIWGPQDPPQTSNLGCQKRGAIFVDWNPKLRPKRGGPFLVGNPTKETKGRQLKIWHPEYGTNMIDSSKQVALVLKDLWIIVPKQRPDSIQT